MDPNANLEEQLRLAKKIMRSIDAGNELVHVDDANRLAELVVALNTWICSGGFLPDNWQPQVHGTSTVAGEKCP